ncbi:Biotin-lipoyl like [Anaeromicropila populeti]|uniref:Biotin-lipoyl like n=2 Tax=Anaeromicropila populeti TaxID=37658 RepID=A0A1I6JPX1_9FIRM|nr:Biotin-lipoyl like [Anaeromicropila populeti]
MKPIIINIEDMSDSREVYESKPNKAGICFIYLVLILAVTALVWMYFGKLDEVVKSEAMLRPNEQIGTVVNQVGGKLTEVRVEDGKQVQKGDVLYQVDFSEQMIQKEYLAQQIQETEAAIGNLKVYKKSVEEDTNLFQQTKEQEAYSVQFETYFLNYSSTIHSADYAEKEMAFSLSSCQQQLQQKETQLLQYNQLKQSIEKGKNLFQNSGETREFYDLYEKYVSGYAQIKSQYEKQAEEISLSTAQEGISNSLEYYQQQLEGYQTLLESVKTEVDSFEADSSYRLRYQQYISQIEKLEQEYQEASDNYNLNVELGDYGVSQQEIDASKVRMEQAEQAIDDYKNSYLTELKETIEGIQKNIQEAELNDSGVLEKKELLEKNETEKSEALRNYVLDYRINLDNTISELEEVVQSLKEKAASLELQQEKAYQYEEQEKEKVDGSVSLLKASEIKTTLETIQGKEEQLENLKKELESVEFSIDHATVTASMDGVVNSNVELVEGDILAAGTEVMTILPNHNNEYKVNIYVSNQDIGKLKIGMDVKLNVYALPNTEYGYVVGTITKISEDIKVNNENTAGYYLVEASLENRKLYNKEGTEFSLKSGMGGQAQIIIGQKRILQYVLEKIELWVRN